MKPVRFAMLIVASLAPTWPLMMAAQIGGKGEEGPHVPASVGEASILDKTGTGGGRSCELKSQSTKSQPLMTAGSLNTERAGFEPAVRFDPHTAFPVPRLRPLGHLSESTKLLL